MPVVSGDASGPQDRRAWERIVDSAKPSDFENFLSAYPSGGLAARAHTRLEALRALVSTGRDPDDPWETLRVSVIFRCCRGDPLWNPMIHGTRQAGKLFNVDVILQNADNDAAQARRQIEAAIDGGFDGIVTMRAFEGATTEVIQRARDAGIAVIIANTSSVGPETRAGAVFVGQDSFASGYRIGRRMVEEHGLGDGDFCVAPAEFPDLGYARGRYAGVKAALEEAGVRSQMIESGVTLDDNLSAISAFLSARPGTDCAIGIGYVATSVLPQAAERAGMAGLPNGGFDLVPEVVDNILAGRTSAVVDQQPFWEGFLPIVLIAYSVRYGLAPADFDSGNALIDRENIALYQRWEGTYR